MKRLLLTLTGAMLKADPALLADEAAAFSMFGDRRWIRVDPTGDEAADAVAALLEAGAAGNPVVLVAGELRKDAKLVKLIAAAPNALACINYPPDGAAADRVVIDLGRAAGLAIAPEVARRIVAGAGNDRAVMAREVTKYADYLDAAPDRRSDLGHDAIDALAPASEEADLDRLLHAVFGGSPDKAADELARLTESGVMLVRHLQRRALLLLDLAGQVAQGNSIDSAVKANRAIFWKSHDAIGAELRRWTPELLATALDRIATAGREVMAASGPGAIAADAVAIDLARVAARRR